MNLAIIEQIIEVLFQAVKYGIQYGPDIIKDLELAWSFATSGTALTDDQKAQADTAVMNAHQALQTQIALDAVNDTPGDSV